MDSLNFGQWYGVTIDHRSYTQNLSSCKIKAWQKKKQKTKNIKLERVTDAVLYQLSYQADWELAILWVRDVPAECQEYKWMYETSLI